MIRNPIMRYSKSPVAVCSTFLAILVLLTVLGPLVAFKDAIAVSSLQLSPPSADHWFGTDLNGRDLFVRVLEGGRISLLVGVVGALVSLSVGTLYGTISGYVGGAVDNVMMRLVDMLYSIPRIVVVIVSIAVFDETVKGTLDRLGLNDWVAHSRLVLLFVCLGLVEWLAMARIARGQVLVLRELAFVQAARALGQTHARIVLRHLLPNIAGCMLVCLTLTIPTVILTESFLSFLGLGVQAPQASLGTLLSDGARFINPVKNYWWLLAAPASFMALMLLTLNFLGDALRDALDPSIQV